MQSFKQFLESNNGKLVIVDIQPAYKSSIHFMDEFANFVKNYNEILVLYNGPEFGHESKNDIAKFYMQHGVDRATINKMRWFQKNYAFFRDPMDYCWARSDIVKIVRYMIKNKIYDARQFTQEDINILRVPQLVLEKLEDYFIGIPELYMVIHKWNNADICGGGLDQCLEEVMILADAMKLHFNLIHDFTY